MGEGGARGTHGAHPAACPVGEIRARKLALGPRPPAGRGLPSCSPPGAPPRLPAAQQPPTALTAPSLRFRLSPAHNSPGPPPRCPATLLGPSVSLTSSGPRPPGHTSYAHVPWTKLQAGPPSSRASGHPLGKRIQHDAPGPSCASRMLGAAEKGTVPTQGPQEGGVESCVLSWRAGGFLPAEEGEDPAFPKAGSVSD